MEREIGEKIEKATLSSKIESGEELGGKGSKSVQHIIKHFVDSTDDSELNLIVEKGSQLLLTRKNGYLYFRNLK